MDTLQLCIVAALLATNVSVIRLGIRLYKLEQAAKEKK